MAPDPAETVRHVATTEMREGAEARVRRLFPTAALRNLDPFVVLDEFFVEPPAGFPEHPHRGFEAITYLLEGAFRHRDNLGNDSLVHAGGAQRFNAGRGLLHSEMPGTAGLAHGLQLWINLPRRLKGMEPSYQVVPADLIPERDVDGGRERIVVGPEGPVDLQTEVRYRDVTLAAGARYSLDVDGLAGLVYVMSGAVRLGEGTAAEGEALVFPDGPSAPVTAEAEGTRFALIAGRPHREPIRQWGPYVD